MSKIPDFENHYVLLSNGIMFDALDPLVFDTDVDTTVTKMCPEGVTVLRCANSPLKIFSLITGKKKTDEFSNFGGTNWGKLFLIHGEYDYFLAYVLIDNEQVLVAKSLNGIFWTFNVNDA